MLLQNIPISWAMRHCAGITRNGGSIDDIFHRSAIRPVFGDDRDQIAFDQMVLLYINTTQWMDDGASGLGKRHMPRHMSTIAAHVMLGCSTFEVALRMMGRLHEGTVVRFGLVVEGEDALITVQSEDPDGPLATTLEELYSVFVFASSGLFLRRLLPVRRLQTRDPLHANLNGRHWATFAPVRLAPVAGLRIPRALLGERNGGHGSDEVQWDMIMPWMAAADGLASRAALQYVNVRDLRVDVLAAEAGVSPSTLRRQLLHTHGGLRAVRQKLLADASIRLLQNSSCSVEAAAAKLGYADARSFRRFLKGATGRTPETLRVERATMRPDPAAMLVRIRETANALAE